MLAKSFPEGGALADALGLGGAVDVIADALGFIFAALDEGSALCDAEVP